MASADTPNEYESDVLKAIAIIREAIAGTTPKPTGRVEGFIQSLLVDYEKYDMTTDGLSYVNGLVTEYLTIGTESSECSLASIKEYLEYDIYWLAVPDSEDSSPKPDIPRADALGDYTELLVAFYETTMSYAEALSVVDELIKGCRKTGRCPARYLAKMVEVLTKPRRNPCPSWPSIPSDEAQTKRTVRDMMNDLNWKHRRLIEGIEYDYTLNTFASPILTPTMPKFFDSLSTAIETLAAHYDRYGIPDDAPEYINTGLEYVNELITAYCDSKTGYDATLGDITSFVERSIAKLPEHGASDPVYTARKRALLEARALIPRGASGSVEEYLEFLRGIPGMPYVVELLNKHIECSLEGSMTLSRIRGYLWFSLDLLAPKFVSMRFRNDTARRSYYTSKLNAFLKRSPIEGLMALDVTYPLVLTTTGYAPSEYHSLVTLAKRAVTLETPAERIDMLLFVLAEHYEPAVCIPDGRKHVNGLLNAFIRSKVDGPPTPSQVEAYLVYEVDRVRAILDDHSLSYSDDD